MVDPRIVEHARILVDYSTKVKAGDMVILFADIDAHDIAVEIVKKVAEKGASTLTLMGSSELSRGYMDAASDEALDLFPKPQMEAIKASDVLISLSSPLNTRALAGVDPKRLMRRSQTTKPISDEVLKKRWCGTIHPNQALAQEAKMSLSEYQDFVYGAVLLDWEKEAKLMRKLRDKLQASDTIQFIGKETDLKASTKDRLWVAAEGTNNMPSGEVFISPVEKTVEGQIYFDIPFLFAGTEIQGVRLEFKDGKVVKHSAERGQKALDALLEVDEGAKYLGEMAIGTNRGIKRYTLNMLFDEKIGDTIHCALGNAYPECKGTNESAVHVDIIKSMKDDGKILAGDFVIYEKGKFFWEK
ncbi:MAG: aminopeptidase [Candidatus Hermodarchaeota archaeon]